MAAIYIDDSLFSTSKDKVVVVTGGAKGIGAAIVERFYRSGAHVNFSDVDHHNGEALQKSLQSHSGSGNGTCEFMHVDVRDYHAQLAQFEAAYIKHGKVNMAVYSAGISEPMGWVISKDMTMESVKQAPSPATTLLEINLHGSLYFSRIALAYLKGCHDKDSSQEASITLIGSAASIQDGPGLCSYTASKAGMVGLMRSLRALAPVLNGVRINVISPWATDTAMIAAHVHIFRDNDIPLNTADDVARYTQYVALDPETNGGNIYVGGGKGYDIEAGLNRSRTQWLGQENMDGWKLQDEAFGKGDWIKTGKD